MNNYKKPESIIPLNDSDRLQKLYQYEILDTPAEEAFDKIAKLAAEIFDTPSAFVTFVDRDRVFFKSNLSSIEGNGAQRKDSLCSLAILEEQITVFNDTHQIPDLLQSPHVSCEGGIRFYAGAPLKSNEGYQLGTLCVVDSVPREASEKQLKMLQTLSSIVVDELEHRLIARQAIKVQTDLLNITAHDLKNPTINISLLADLLKKQGKDDPLMLNLVSKVKYSAEDIMQKLEGLLNLSLLENGDLELNLETFQLQELLISVKSNFDLLAQQKQQMIFLQCDPNVMVRADRLRLREVFENLLSNAIKYSPIQTEIFLKVMQGDQQVLINFQDQGLGLNESDMKKLFTKFAKLSSQPTGKERSNRLGLSIVKTLVELHQGKVWAQSGGKNQGTTFTVALPASTAVDSSSGAK